MEILNKMYDLQIKKKEIENQIKELQDKILKLCDDVVLENELIKITIIPATSYQTIDMKKVKEKEPSLYKELEDIYSKTVNRKSYVKATIK